MLDSLRSGTACAGALLLSACAAFNWIGSPQLGGALSGSHRELQAQDSVRRPVATLEFFGVTAGQTVLEVWPEDGYYTEILAPLLRDDGEYWAAGYAVSSSQAKGWQRESMLALLQKLARHPDLYDRVRLVELGPGAWHDGPRGTADVVLSDGHFHAWLKGGYEGRMLQALHRALKPGGVLGIIEPRAAPKTSRAESLKSGYVTEARVVAAARAAGFRLEEASEFNANPGDDRKPAEPARPGRRDRSVDMDRMTLKFVKPAPRKPAAKPKDKKKKD